MRISYKVIVLLLVILGVSSLRAQALPSLDQSGITPVSKTRVVETGQQLSFIIGNLKERTPTRRNSKTKGRVDKAIKLGSRAGNIRAIIDLSEQRMTIKVGGVVRHTWPISSGRAGYATPTGKFRPQRAYSQYYSKKYDLTPMPSAVFFNGGIAVHGTSYTSRLGRPASHGCVRLAPGNASQFLQLAKTYGRNIEIIVQR